MSKKLDLFVEIHDKLSLTFHYIQLLGTLVKVDMDNTGTGAQKYVATTEDLILVTLVVDQDALLELFHTLDILGHGATSQFNGTLEVQ